MEHECIRVIEGPDRAWTVTQEPHRRRMLSFDVKSHAIAFARAVSFSRKLALFVDDAYGVAIRQSPASLKQSRYAVPRDAASKRTGPDVAAIVIRRRTAIELKLRQNSTTAKSGRPPMPSDYDKSPDYGKARQLAMRKSVRRWKRRDASGL